MLVSARWMLDTSDGIRAHSRTKYESAAVEPKGAKRPLNIQRVGAGTNIQILALDGPGNLAC